MAFDGALPAVGSNYSTVFVPKILEHQLALASWFESAYVTTYANLATGVKRLESGLIQEWNGTAWAEKVVGYAKKAGDTFTGKVITKASATSGAGLNLPHGAAPTTPVNGDIWTTTTAVFARLNGANAQLVSTAGTGATGSWAIDVTGTAATAPTAAACSGNAATASALATARTISFTGDATGSGSFTGAADLAIVLTVADNSHLHTIANITGLQTTLDAKAPLASPAFTGTPTVPTAAAASNDTTAASTAFVTSAISTAASSLAPKASPVFTGSVQVPAGTAAAPGLKFTGATTMGLYASGTTTLGFAVAGAAAATLTATAFTATGNVTAYSDQRLKTDFRRKYLTLDEILAMEHFQYRRRDTGIFQTGVKAQAVQKVLPLVVEEDEERILSVDYGRLATAVSLSLSRVVEGLVERLDRLEAA